MRSLHHQFNFDNYSIENLASNEWPIGGLIGLWKNRIDVTARITGACLSERPASSFAGGAVKLHQSIVECWTGAGFPFLLAVVHLFTFLFILPVISAHFFLFWAFIMIFFYYILFFVVEEGRIVRLSHSLRSPSGPQRAALIPSSCALSSFLFTQRENRNLFLSKPFINRPDNWVT